MKYDNSGLNKSCNVLWTHKFFERTSPKNYQTRNQMRAGVFDYIERFYNPRRRHSTLGYVSPDQFEQAQLSLQ